MCIMKKCSNMNSWAKESGQLHPYKKNRILPVHYYFFAELLLFAMGIPMANSQQIIIIQ